MGYYYDKLEEAREGRETTRCLICGVSTCLTNESDEPSFLCHDCEVDLKIHRRLHEFEDKWKEEQK